MQVNGIFAVTELNLDNWRLVHLLVLNDVPWHQANVFVSYACAYEKSNIQKIYCIPPVGINIVLLGKQTIHETA